MAFINRFYSPLRYPGGKSKVAPFIEDLILLNNLEGCTLYELYAGGAGASLSILFSGICRRIVLNDLDYHIYAFWHSILNETDELIKRINEEAVNVENWEKQKTIYSNFQEHEILDVGFSTFFLNRTNRSGIISNAGPIGGKKQNGKYKIDVRFNKLELSRRVEMIAKERDRIEIRNQETMDMLETEAVRDEKGFIFLDPPYYRQGENLYLNSYDDNAHTKLSNLLKTNREANWFLTYDNCDRITKLYQYFRRAHLPMNYAVQSKRKAKEVMIFAENLYIPKSLRIGTESTKLSILR